MPGVGAVLVLAILGFVGFESAVVFSEESKDPKRTVPLATYLSVAIIAGLYALSSWTMTVAVGPDQIVAEAGEQSVELIFNLAAAHLGDTAVTIGQVLFLTSVLAAMISFHNTTARYTFALGRERVLPAVFGQTSAAHRRAAGRLAGAERPRPAGHPAVRGQRLGPGGPAVLLGRHHAAASACCC